MACVECSRFPRFTGHDVIGVHTHVEANGERGAAAPRVRVFTDDREITHETFALRPGKWAAVYVYDEDRFTRLCECGQGAEARLIRDGSVRATGLDGTSPVRVLEGVA